MLNDNKNITTSSVPVGQAMTVYRKKFKLISLVLLIVGLIGVIAYIAVGTVYSVKYDNEPLWIKALLIFAVPFALGLIGFITVIRLQRREAKEADRANCVFYADCFFYKIENKSNEKFSYSDAVLKSENDRFGYIYILSRGLFAVFSKEGLTDGELNAIRKNFRKTVESEDIAELENFKEEDNK